MQSLHQIAWVLQVRKYIGPDVMVSYAKVGSKKYGLSLYIKN